MTKEAFVAAHLDELIGILLRAFALEENTRGMAGENDARRGKFMNDTLKRAEAIMARMHETLHSKKTPDELVELFLTHYGKLTPTEGKEATDKLRARLQEKKS